MKPHGRHRGASGELGSQRSNVSRGHEISRDDRSHSRSSVNSRGSNRPWRGDRGSSKGQGPLSFQNVSKQTPQGTNA